MTAVHVGSAVVPCESRQNHSASAFVELAAVAMTRTDQIPHVALVAMSRMDRTPLVELVVNRRQRRHL